jgi:pilus assembly protein CpaE
VVHAYSPEELFVIHVAVLDRERQISSILVQILSRATTLGHVQSSVSWDELRRLLAVQSRTVVVLGPSMNEADLQQSATIARDYPGTSFVQVVDHLEVESLQLAMRYGIRDVIAVQDAESALLAAVERTHSAAQATLSSVARSQDDAPGKVVAVFGTKGGTGKTLVATNVAVLAAKAGIRTALLDANVWFGDCAACLRVRPQRTLADLAGIAGPIDESAYGSALISHDSGVKVLCAPNDPLDAEKLSGSLLTRVIQGLRRSFELTVVDTGATLDQFTLAPLSQSDIACLVTSLELPAVKDAKLALSLFKNLDLSVDKVRVVLNRSNSKVGFPADEVAKALGRRVVAQLPSDVLVPRSVNNGVPVTLDSPKSKVSKNLARFADELRAELFPTGGPPPRRGDRGTGHESPVSRTNGLASSPTDHRSTVGGVDPARASESYGGAR